MFDWLDVEIAQIKTRNFHVIDGPASLELRDAVEHASIRIPASYRYFVLNYGNAHLYSSGSNYLVEVFAAPKELEAGDGEMLLHIARTDQSLAYFKESLLQESDDSPVFEWRQESGLECTNETFDEWLKLRCAEARRLLADQWRAIEEGPAPFTSYELEVVQARRGFRWNVVGIAANGDLRFEVENRSCLVLPYLTIGIRRKGGSLIGGIWLPVASVMPGNTAILQHDCYKEILTPEETEPFPLPDPGPEDREQYWEFKITQ